MINFFKNAKKHFITITSHRIEVMKNCFKAGLYYQGIVHDLSKYSPTEFITGALHYQGDKSPNEGERSEYGYSKAWIHHKGRNRHHYEYWNDYNPVTHRTEGVEMPPRYFVEMICDRIAASKIYKGSSYTDSSPLEYYLNRKSVNLNIMISPKTDRHLEKVLRMLAKEGEEETFRYLRAYLRYSRKKQFKAMVAKWL